MKLFLAAISLWAVAVMALRTDRMRSSWQEVEPREVQPFRANQEYRYRLDTQISSGFASVSDQHSSTRLQSQIILNFQSERSVVLKMEQIVMGTMNRDIPDPEKVQPIEMFQKTSIEGQETKVLRLPLTFDYVDGIVERIRFHPEDKPWSKNIKRSVLNMLQLNLKQKDRLTEIEPTDEPYPTIENKKTDEVKTRMFLLPELTLEGECYASYVLNRMSPKKWNREMETSRDAETFNVTKTIDFKQCKKIADIKFGPRVEKACEKCDLEDLEERKLDRTTILRHVIVGNTETYGIHKVELVSHYIFKSLNAEMERPMRTIVAGELRYVSSESSRRSEGEDPQRMDKDETLLFSTEWDKQEKRFYMYGDEEFPKSSPFERVQNKPAQIERLISKLVHFWADKNEAIENEASITFTRLVELVRMCTLKELREAHSKVRGHDRLTETEKVHAEDIFVDALSNAGTHNTVKMLVEKIQKNEIDKVKAIRAITGLKGMPMPSEKIVELLLDLCNSEAVERSGALRQTTWLTTGAIMGEVCDDELTTEDAFEQQMKKPMCPREKKQEYVKKIMDFFRQANTRYEKILALKTLGNAGMDESVYELEKIINEIGKDPIVRMQAIDSLRRLRAVMPRKIQRILMPIFQNIRERPEIRMAALSQMLPTIPEKHVLDQIGYVLLREPSRQVKSYVYTAMKYLSRSPIPTEKNFAERLMSLLKLAGITEEDEQEIIRGSRFYRVPLYSAKQREGISAEWESMVGPDNFLPKHISASIDTIFSTILEKNNLELRLTQENVEQWLEKIWDLELFSISPLSSEFRNKRTSKRQPEDSSNSEEFDDVTSLSKKLSIQRRRREHYTPIDSDSIEPYGMFCLRYADIDYVVVPLEEQLLPHFVKKFLVSGEKLAVEDFEELSKYMQGKRIRLQAAYNVLEHSVKIPTSMGLPIRMWHVLPVMGSVDGQIKTRFSRSDVNAEIELHPVMTATHIKRVEVWCPIIITGVETMQAVEFNLPIEGMLKTKFGSEKSLSWSLKLPEKKTRLVGFHSLPTTFVAEKDENTGMHKNAMVKRVENLEMQDRLRTLDRVYGHRMLDLPIKITGDMHMPRELTSYHHLLSTLLTTENHVHLEFEPTSGSPREIEILVDTQLFRPNDERSKSHRELKGFYSKAKFDDEVERYYEEDSSDEENKLTSFLDSYEPRKMYKHEGRIHIRTKGGRQEKYCKIEIQAACDERLKHCTAEAEIKRSPLLEEERSDWQGRMKLQTLYPEYVNDVEELSSQTKKHQRFVCQAEVEWTGSLPRQTVRMSVNGEQFKPKLWLEKIGHERYSSEQLEEKLKIKTAFLNKYDVSAEYKLNTWSKAKLSQWMSLMKTWNFWNTKTQPMLSGRDETFFATVLIDPVTHEHLNISLKTPYERVVIDSIRLPGKFKPFELVRKTSTRATNFMELVQSYSSKSRPECVVDGRKVDTFDDVTFKAPLTKCYSVLAKDCSNETPRFAVMMKKVNDEHKKLKVVTGKNTIQVEKINDKLVVKINDERMDDARELLDYGVDYDTDMVQIDTRDISVRFDGKKCWIKLSEFYKNSQCGLCGHYNDDTDDEFRMNNNEHTYDLKAFHKSYSIQDEQCREDLEETHRRERYEQIDSDEWDRDSREETKEETKKPIEKTHMMELYNHKVCFSQRPVKECPKNTEPKEEKEQKMPFLCFSRTSTEGRRLIREAKRNPRAVLDLPTEQNPSFIETLRIPQSCEVY